MPVILLALTSQTIQDLAVQQGASVTEARIVDAVAWKESSRQEHVPGDNGAAWGLFQFHKDRWKELGGKEKDYGSASAKEQIRVMLVAVRHAKKRSATGIENWIIYLGRWHNIGNCPKAKRTVHTAYTKDVWNKYLAIKGAK